MRTCSVPLQSMLLSATALFCLSTPCANHAQSAAPHLESENGHHALMVDGSPYLVLAGQINNSSAWPDVLPKAWPALAAIHVNTVEAPVYWEQMEPSEGKFDWTSVDALLEGARAHKLHLVLLWFGTWKNGNDHYVPAWVKRDTHRFPRMMNSSGTPLDVLSANAEENMHADRAAFTALMKHLAERDGSEHTVLMVQVENESGAIGTVRDFSPEANRQFAEQVPATLVKALGKQPGTWSQVFGARADESFQAWSQARYINAIAEAGKKQFNIPLYCNVWLAYPPAELPERHIAIPGIGYPSGGAVQGMLPLWKAAAPAIDLLGPDMYSDNPQFYESVLRVFAQDNNPLFVPESGMGPGYGPMLFAALGQGAIGFSTFGVDWTDWTLKDGVVPRLTADEYALIGSMQRTVARLEYEGKVRTAEEAIGGADQQIAFGAHLSHYIPEPPVDEANATVALDEAGDKDARSADAAGAWVAEVRFGFPQPDGAPAPGTAHKQGSMLIAQLGPDEFLLTGVDGAVFFRRPGLMPGIRMQIVTAEEGYFTSAAEPGAPEVWHRTRLLNGDQDDRGIQFRGGEASAAAATPASASHEDTPAEHIAVRVTLGRF